MNKARKYVAGTAVAAIAVGSALALGGHGAGAAGADSWTLYPGTTTTDTYAAQVQQPINPDGTSVWAAKRGVIPVQFTLTDTTTTAVAPFQSIGSDTNTANDYSYASYTPAAGTTVADLTSLVANYIWTLGTDHGGSLRWSISTSAGHVFVYFGDAPSFTAESLGSGSGANLLTSSDLRFDTSQVGGTFYDTWAHAQALVGAQPVNAVSLVLDGGWGGDQVLNLTTASVNSSTFTMPTGTSSTTTQTNAIPALVDLYRTSGATPGVIDETTLTSAQGDTGGHFRQVDGKYIYNLDVSGLGTGTYKVYLKIGSDVSSPGIFGLK